MQLRHDPLYPSRRSPVLADNVVASSQPLTAQAGMAMLAQGGNAADAALAAAIAMTVVEPTGNGLGSDAFCLLWDGAELHGLNASGRSPAAWTPERFAGLERLPKHGFESVTTPGAVSGWVALSERFGKLPFADLFAPAIRYAEEGFLLSPIIAEQWRRGAEILSDQPGFAVTFLREGRPPAAGERFVNRALGRTLRLIAETRGEAFYRGEIAERMAAFAAEHGAALSAEDLAAHKANWCGSIAQEFDGVALHEIPPNGQGIAAQIALGMLAHTPIRDYGPDDPAALHLMIEAMRIALADARAYVADPAYMTSLKAADLLDPTYLEIRAREIQPDRAENRRARAPREGGTIYVTAADADGMMVSFIQSNYSGFGSGVAEPSTGVHFQNRAFGFTLEEGHPNQIGPSKRPFHTIIPGFLMKDGAPLMSFGVMGGPMQAQGHLQMTLRTQLWGQDPQTAIDAPRWRVTDGLGLACEPSWPAETLQALRDLGHEITLEAPDAAFGFGGAQLIQKLPGGGYVAGSDPRKDGQAVGF